MSQDCSDRRAHSAQHVITLCQVTELQQQQPDQEEERHMLRLAHAQHMKHLHVGQASGGASSGGHTMRQQGAAKVHLLLGQAERTFAVT